MYPLIENRVADASVSSASVTIAMSILYLERRCNRASSLVEPLPRFDAFHVSRRRGVLLGTQTSLPFVPCLTVFGQDLVLVAQLFGCGRLRAQRGPRALMGPDLPLGPSWAVEIQVFEAPLSPAFELVGSVDVDFSPSPKQSPFVSSFWQPPAVTKQNFFALMRLDPCCLRRCPGAAASLKRFPTWGSWVV